MPLKFRSRWSARLRVYRSSVLLQDLRPLKWNLRCFNLLMIHKKCNLLSGGDPGREVTEIHYSGAEVSLQVWFSNVMSYETANIWREGLDFYFERPLRFQMPCRVNWIFESELLSSSSTLLEASSRGSHGSLYLRFKSAGLKIEKFWHSTSHFSRISSNCMVQTTKCIKRQSNKRPAVIFQPWQLWKLQLGCLTWNFVVHMFITYTCLQNILS